MPSLKSKIAESVDKGISILHKYCSVIFINIHIPLNYIKVTISSESCLFWVHPMYVCLFEFISILLIFFKSYKLCLWRGLSAGKAMHSVILAFRRMSQENHEFKASQGYTAILRTGWAINVFFIDYFCSYTFLSIFGWKFYQLRQKDWHELWKPSPRIKPASNITIFIFFLIFSSQGFSM